MTSDDIDPDWDTQLTISLTPAVIAHVAFTSAPQVHTGWESCLDPQLIIAELNAVQDETGNHCRLVQQEYEEEGDENIVWHDWTVELKLGQTFLSAHWRTSVTSSGAEWDWCVREAEAAFKSAGLLVGKRITRGMVVDDLPASANVTRH